MTCDITVFREHVTSHPDKKDVTLVEREELWSGCSWDIGKQFASRFDIGSNQMIWTSPCCLAETATDVINETRDFLRENDIKSLHDLVDICNEEVEGNYSYTLIIDC